MATVWTSPQRIDNFPYILAFGGENIRVYRDTGNGNLVLWDYTGVANMTRLEIQVDGLTETQFFPKIGMTFVNKAGVWQISTVLRNAAGTVVAGGLSASPVPSVGNTLTVPQLGQSLWTTDIY